MRPSSKAWAALAAYVIIYNLSAPEGEMLSERCDRWQEARPWLTRAVITLVAVHLANGVPQSIDPVHWVFLAARSCRRAVSHASGYPKR